MIRSTLILALVAATAAFAQEKKEIRKFEIRVDAPPGAASHAVFAAGGAAPMMHVQQFAAHRVKGAPYSAEASTETVQTLADGNRIIHKSVSRMYRDAEGRTRTETTMPPAGLWTPAGGEFTLTFIMDPVSGVHYTVNSKEKVATKVAMPPPPPPPPAVAGEGAKTMKIDQDVIVHRTAAGAGPMMPHGAGPAVMVFERREGFPLTSAPNANTESLGKQAMEGVMCEGTRETITIPAGQIGNEREIKTVVERWHSPELGFDVLRKSTDPRAGDTTYRVSRIVRSDQPKSLFEPPADYRLEDVKMRMPAQVKEEMVIRRRNAKE